MLHKGQIKQLNTTFNMCGTHGSSLDVVLAPSAAAVAVHAAGPVLVPHGGRVHVLLRAGPGGGRHARVSRHIGGGSCGAAGRAARGGGGGRQGVWPRSTTGGHGGRSGSRCGGAVGSLLDAGSRSRGATAGGGGGGRGRCAGTPGVVVVVVWGLVLMVLVVVRVVLVTTAAAL